MLKWKDSFREDIILLYTQGYSLRDLGIKYNVSHQTIIKWLKDLNVTRRTRNGQHRREYICNDNYFDSIDHEHKAYWLGFLAADGCVYGNSFTLELQVRDLKHLQKLRDHLEGDQPISFRKNCAAIRVCSKQIIDRLYNNGIHERKDFTVFPPKLEFDLMKHYWRGVIEGDGSINLKKNSFIFM